jgi:hypothetical protein
MANYFVPLTPQRPGPGLNLEPVNAALDGIIQQNDRNRQFGMQQQQIDAQGAERTYQHGRDAKQDAMQQVQFYGKQATAVDQMQGPQRAAAWSTILAKHGTQGLSPEELDPVTGPKLMAAQAGQYLDPRDSQAKDLELQKTRAEIGKLNSEAANGGEAYGKTGTIFLNPETNRYEAVQFGGRGQVKRTELGGLTPARGTGEIDTGTGTQIIDKATGQPIRTVNKDIAGAASAKEQGEAAGKSIVDLPRQVDNANMIIDTIEKIRNHPGRSWGTGTIGGVIPGIPGTEQRGFVNLVDQAKGQAFLQAFNSLRGGGQITEAEGSKATQALARLDRAQNDKDFEDALNDFEEVVTIGLARAKAAARRQPAPTTPASASSPAPSESPPNSGWSIKRVN